MINQQNKPTLSAFIICLNEEKNIRRCLDSLRWCDEIVIIDSGSTDSTLSICREYTDRIYQREWPGFVAQKQFGLDQCRSDWVLNIDADEEVSDELRVSIQSAMAGPADIHGYELLRVVFFLGKWWRQGGWFPEYRLRLVRAGAAKWGGENPHERAIVAGPTPRLAGELRHYTYDNFSNQVAVLNRFSQISAESLHKRGVRFSLSDLIARPISRFFKFYLLRKGYREGFSGLLVAILEGFYTFLKYIKLWELERQEADSQITTKGSD